MSDAAMTFLKIEHMMNSGGGESLKGFYAGQPPRLRRSRI
jgi:hypothetical protein